MVKPYVILLVPELEYPSCQKLPLESEDDVVSSFNSGLTGL